MRFPIEKAKNSYAGLPGLRVLEAFNHFPLHCVHESPLLARLDAGVLWNKGSPEPSSIIRIVASEQQAGWLPNWGRVEPSRLLSEEGLFLWIAGDRAGFYVQTADTAGAIRPSVAAAQQRPIPISDVHSGPQRKAHEPYKQQAMP